MSSQFRCHDDGPAARLTENPFFVLGVPTSAPWPWIRRHAETLLEALEAGEPSAACYATPLGLRRRTPRLVERALMRLRDPDERVQHEIWARVPTKEHAPLPLDADQGTWDDAPAAFGWRS